MPANSPLKRYIPIALIIMIALAGFSAAYPSFWFHLLDPIGTLEKLREQQLYAIGSADSPLTAIEAQALFDQKNVNAGRSALLQQDQKHGLPDDFISHLEDLLVDGGDQYRKAAYLIERLALHRQFDERVERTFLERVRTTTGGTNTQPISALGNIGAHRALTDETLTVLLDVALRRSSAEQTALAALAKTAPFGLPDWALDGLEEIAERRPGAIRSDAIKVIAAAGAQERATAIVNKPGNSPVYADAIATTLSGNALPSLLNTLRDDTQNIELRTGALNELVQRRDQSELVGQALAYAFTSDETALRLTAFNTFSEWGRHHARYIDVSWREVCRRAFADENEAVRVRSASAFRFMSFADNQTRDQFLLEMLQGTETQQLSALQAASGTSMLADPVKQAITSLTDSANPSIAGSAGMLAERYRPKGRFEGLGSWLTGVTFLGLLGLPALTAMGFETYFVARLLQNIANGSKRLATILASVAWFVLSLGLGLTLFMGVMGLGHSGSLSGEIYLFLIVVNTVFFGIGWLLSLAVRQRHFIQTT